MYAAKAPLTAREEDSRRLAEYRYYPQSLGFPWQAHVVLAEVKANPSPAWLPTWVQRHHVASLAVLVAAAAVLAWLRRRPAARETLLHALKSSGSRVSLWKAACMRPRTRASS